MRGLRLSMILVAATSLHCAAGDGGPDLGGGGGGGPFLVVDVGSAPSKGPADAPVLVVEFGDFQ